MRPVKDVRGWLEGFERLNDTQMASCENDVDTLAPPNAKQDAASLITSRADAFGCQYRLHSNKQCQIIGRGLSRHG